MSNQEWPDREGMYQEGTAFHLDYIEDLQRIIDLQDERIRDLESDVEYYKYEASRPW